MKIIKRKNKRYNLKKVIKRTVTIRCKILAIIGWIFNLNIEEPDYEIIAKVKKFKKGVKTKW